MYNYNSFIVINVRSEQPDEKKSDHVLKIAWRYQDQVNSPAPVPKNQSFCSAYDLSAPRHATEEKALVEAKEYATLCDASDLSLAEIYQSVQLALEKARTHLPRPRILRIVIDGFGSLAWYKSIGSSDEISQEKTLLRFFQSLKALVRSSPALCFISVPSHLHASSFNQKLRHLADTVFSIQSFSGSGNPVSEIFQDFTGMFNVIKLPHLNSLIFPVPENPTFVFVRQRRRLIIETIHLPPEFARSSKKEDSSSSSSSSSSASASSASASSFKQTSHHMASIDF